MGWRFRRTVRLFPGVRLNFSQSGVSTTIGTGPATLNLGPQGTHINLNVPGTGLTYRERLGAPSEPVPSEGPSSPPPRPAAAPIATTPLAPSSSAISSASTFALTSPGLAAFRDMLLQADEQRRALQRDLAAASEEANARARAFRSYDSTILRKRLFPKRLALLRGEHEEAQTGVVELRNQFRDCRVATELTLDPSISEPFMLMRDRFAALSASRRIWDTLSRTAVDQKTTRSAAAHSIERTEVHFKLAQSDLLHASWNVPYLENANGGDLFLYPAFLLYRVSASAFAVVDCRQVEIVCTPYRFIEEEAIPEDATVVGRTWAKVNKDGSPDRRFTGNREIPVVQYGRLRIACPTGLNEEYCVSNLVAGQAFAQSWQVFRKALPADQA